MRHGKYIRATHSARMALTERQRQKDMADAKKKRKHSCWQSEEIELRVEFRHPRTKVWTSTTFQWDPRPDEHECGLALIHKAIEQVPGMDDFPWTCSLEMYTQWTPFDLSLIHI